VYEYEFLKFTLGSPHIIESPGFFSKQSSSPGYYDCKGKHIMEELNMPMFCIICLLMLCRRNLEAERESKAAKRKRIGWRYEFIKITCLLTCILNCLLNF